MSTGWREALQHGLGARYHIRQELGGGGMSATFIAEETALGRSVVLKALSPELSVGLNVERFEREIHLAARLQHAFIVPLLSAGVSDGQPWYTMPLVQGESLRARIAREGAITPNATARILRDVAEALAYAHAQGVVHRDIKPDNILLSGAHALVTDFGVAKAVSVSTAGAGMTGVGVAIGTPAYMAPEQAAGDPNVDHRVDLYALGSTAYEMLSARSLFGNRSLAETFAAHMSEDPAPLATVAPGVPQELAALVGQLLAKHPNDRPRSAEDVAGKLTMMLTRWTSGDAPPLSVMTFGRALALWGAVFVGVVGAASLAVRWLPVPDWTLPAAVLVMLAGLPVLALTAWLHRPARPIAPLPSVASTTTAGRIEAIVRPHVTWRRAARGGAIALGALVVVAGAWAASRALGVGPAATLRTQGVVASNDRLFIADFESPATDTSLGLVVTDLLRTEIGRSASIVLLSSEERSAALTAMQLPMASRIGGARAREFSQRANAKVFLSGVVAQLGSGYLLRATLFETSTGRELAAFRESARSADEVVGAVDRIGREARGRLGASLREVRGATPLFFAVTPSLAAARKYTEGLTLAGLGDQRAGLQSLERAVQIDTEFASAYRSMAAYYANTGNPERMAWAAERAFRFRSKLSPIGQRLVEGTYYTNSTEPDLDKSIAAYEAAIELSDSANGAALNNVGLNYEAKRDFERALDAYRGAMRADSSGCSFATTNALIPMWATGRMSEVRQYIDTGITRRCPRRVVALDRASLASAELDVDSAERIRERALQLETGATRNQRADMYVNLSYVQRAKGRLVAAAQSRWQSLQLNPAADTVGKFPSSVLSRAQVAAWDLERPAEARRLLDSAFALHPPGDAGPLGYRWLDLATAYARAGDPATARSLLASFEQRASVALKANRRRDLPLARGWTAIAEKRYGDATAAFRAADVGVCTICALAPLGYAYDLAGMPDSAIAVLERYIATNYWGRTLVSRAAIDAQYLAGTYKRLGELYDAKGEVEKATKYYSRFVDLWKNADPELQSKGAQVRKRLAALRSRQRQER